MVLGPACGAKYITKLDKFDYQNRNYTENINCTFNIHKYWLKSPLIESKYTDKEFKKHNAIHDLT